MKEYVKAYIQWFRNDIKWQEIPLDGIRFCPQIKFEEEGYILPKWTAEIIIRRANTSSSCYVDLKYLFEHAPHYLLIKGKKFIIFDGLNAIAKGEIVEDSADKKKSE